VDQYHNISILDFIGAKDDGDGGNNNIIIIIINRSYKTCKALVESSLPTNQHPVFYRLDALPVAQPTVSSTEGK